MSAFHPKLPLESRQLSAHWRSAVIEASCEVKRLGLLVLGFPVGLARSISLCLFGSIRHFLPGLCGSKASAANVL
jgi:hypothetical protein